MGWLARDLKDHVVCGWNSLPTVAVLSEKKLLCICWTNDSW